MKRTYYTPPRAELYELIEDVIMASGEGQGFNDTTIGDNQII